MRSRSGDLGVSHGNATLFGGAVYWALVLHRSTVAHTLVVPHLCPFGRAFVGYTVDRYGLLISIGDACLAPTIHCQLWLFRFVFVDDLLLAEVSSELDQRQNR